MMPVCIGFNLRDDHEPRGTIMYDCSTVTCANAHYCKQGGRLRRLVSQLMAMALFMGIHGAVGAIGTFISAPQRVDLVYDDGRGVVYITNGAQVLRYSLREKAFLPPIILGGTLKGIDISADGNTLAVADTTAVGGFAGAHLVDLNTSVTTKTNYPLESSYAEGPPSVAFCSDGKLLIATGAQWGKLHRYDPATRLVTDIANSFRHRSMLCASGDRSVVGYAEGDISDGAWGRYRTSDGHIQAMEGYTNGTSWFNYEIGVNRNGTQYAIPTYNGTFIYNQNLVKSSTKIGTYAGPQPMGLVYSPVSDVVYFPWSGSRFVYAYDTNTFQQIGAYDFENTFDNNGNSAYTEGRMKMSRDGKLLFGTVAGGVRFVRFSARPVADEQTVTVSEDSAVSIALTATDADNDPLTFAIATQPGFGTLSGTMPNLTYTPNRDYSGPDAFRFTASDGDLVSSSTVVNITVASIPDAPVAQSQNRTTLEETPLNIVLRATDAEGDLLTYRVTTSPAYGTLSGTDANVTYTPAEHFNGVDQFQFVANDGTQDSAAATVQLTVVNRADRPVADPQDVTLSEDSSVSITLTAMDPDNDDLAYVVVAEPLNGTLHGTAPELLYTPNPDYFGTDSFVFHVNDGLADSLDTTVTITVENVQDIPVAAGQAVETLEDTPVDMDLQAADADGDTLNYRVTVAPTYGGVSGSGPEMVYTPGADFHGGDTFEYVANDGMDDSPPALVEIAVTNTPDRPVAHGLSVSTVENTPLDITLHGTDADAEALAYTISSTPQHGSLTGVVPHLVYLPAAGYVGADAFSFHVNDGNGDSVDAVVNITVTAGPDIPHVPVAQGQSLQTVEDVALAITLTATDLDGDTLMYQVSRGPLHGTLSGTAPDLVYTPAPGYHGNESFEFIAADAGSVSAPALINIFVGDTIVNSAPVAGVVQVVATWKQPASFTLTATDADNDQLEFLLKSVPQHGKLTGDLPNLTYTPDKKFLGTDSFQYKVEDGNLSAVGTVEITVLKKTNGVVAHDQAVFVVGGEPAPVTLTGWSALGSMGYRLTKLPKKGTLTGTAPNLVYTPETGAVGQDIIKFRVTSNGNKSRNGIVKIFF